MRELGRFNLDVPEPEYIGTDEEAAEFLRLCMRKVEVDKGDPIGFDTETHGLKIEIPGRSRKPLDWMRDTVLFWSLSFKLERQWHRYCLRQQDFYRFIPFLENPKTLLAVWNLKYDGHVSYNSGVDIWNSGRGLKTHGPIDVMAMGYLVDENLQGDMGLKARCAEGLINSESCHKLGVTPWKQLNMTKYADLFGTKDPETGKRIKEYETSLLELPLEKVIDYASLDAYGHAMMFEHARSILEKIECGNWGSMWNYFVAMEIDITKTLWRMERRGLKVDEEYLEKQIPGIEEESAEILREINREAGRPINLNSTPQLVQLFYGEGGLGLKPIKMTKGGQRGPQPSTDEEVLNKHADAGVPIAEKIVRYRSIQKTKNTYMESLILLSRHYKDGRIHPGFNQFGARTGRFSSENPNSMNFPRPDNDEFAIRAAFVAEEGNGLIVGDYEQLEMRIMADRSGDPAMLDAINRGMDLHCVTVARMMPGVTYEEAVAAKKAKDKWKEGDAALGSREKELCKKRQDSKTIGFALIYGAGAANIAGQLKITKQEAQKKIDAYFKAYPGVKLFMEDTVQFCIENEYVETLIGRLRRLPMINSPDFMVRSHAERESVNSPIQGSAADIVKAAMINIENSKELNELGIWLVNQIHDELVMEGPLENLEEALPYVRDYMEHPFAKGEHPLKVPAPCSIKIASNWAQAK